MEELLLGALLPGEKLHVVDKENVAASVLVPESEGRPTLDRGDELVHERLGRNVVDRSPRALLTDVVADRLHEVRLPEADPTIDKQRVICRPRSLCDRHARGLGEAVAAPDHERVEGVSRVELRFARRGRRGLRRLGTPGRHRLVLVRPPVRYLEGGLHVTASRIAESALDEGQVVFLEPVGEEPVGDLHLQGIVGQLSGARRLEPCLVALLLGLGADRFEALGPQLRGAHRCFTPHPRGVYRLSTDRGNRRKSTNASERLHPVACAGGGTMDSGSPQCG